MKTFVRLALTALLAGWLLSPASAQEKSPQPDPEELEKLYAEWAKLAPEHARFKKFVGKWTTESKNFMDNPDEPTVSKGSSTFRLILGGRFLQQRYQGEFNGQKFDGIGLNGYDKAKKAYTGIWIDNFGTGMMFTKGTVDENGVMTETGESDSPAGTMTAKMVTKLMGKNAFSMTMYMVTPDGDSLKTMEIVYTRDTSKKKNKKDKKGKKDKKDSDDQ